MTPSEVLARARKSATRLVEIENLREMAREHVGVQGHKFATVSCGSILDPMRKVLALIDDFEALDVEAQACTADVEDADTIIRGVRNLYPDDGDTVARVLSRHVEGMDVVTIAHQVGIDATTVNLIITDGMQVLDSLGLARLRAAGA